MRGPRRIVFVGGIPGVGKTTLCARILEKLDGVQHLSAGQLIRAELRGSEREYAREPVPDEDAAVCFQEVLIRAFDKVRNEHSGHLLLDGHFVVPSERGMVPVDVSVFERLGVTDLVLVETETVVVAERLAAREVSAGWWDGSTEMLVELAASERRRGCAVSEELGCAIARMGPEDTERAVVEMPWWQDANPSTSSDS